MSMFGSSMSWDGFVVSIPAGMAKPRSRPAPRTAILLTSTGTPTRWRINSAFSRKMRNAPVPTVPKPIIPTLIFCFIRLSDIAGGHRPLQLTPREPLPPRLFLILIDDHKLRSVQIDEPRGLFRGGGSEHGGVGRRNGPNQQINNHLFLINDKNCGFFSHRSWQYT